MRSEIKVIALSYAESQLGYICVVSEINGTKKLPIIIKPHDAQTIAVSIENLVISRPLTHHIFKNLCEISNMDVIEVEIYDFVDGIFYSKLILSNHIDIFDIETSAGDAIALSHVFNCSLYINNEIMDVHGINTDEDGNLIQDEADDEKRLTIEELEVMIEQSIADEQYEIAAQYRDRINELKKLS